MIGSIPAASNTASKTGEYWPAPSWITNRNLSGRSMRRLRAAWVVHATVGLVVIPARCTRLDPTSMKNRTWRRRRVAVSTQQKSVAITARAWDRMNCAHVGPVRFGVGSIPASRRIFQTLEGATLWADPGQFAVDAPVAPDRVFAGHVNGKTSDLGVHRRPPSSGGGGLGPSSGDEAAVPPDHGGRLHDQEHFPQTRPVERGGQHRQDGAVRLVEDWSGDMSLQDEDLEAQREDLGVTLVAGGETANRGGTTPDGRSRGRGSWRRRR